MLKNETWQPVPGMEHTLLYPIIKKTNITTSNAFLFQSPHMIMIIDPGNLPEQLEVIRQAIGKAPEKGSRPVIAYLTHCHVDHCFELARRSHPTATGINARGFGMRESVFRQLLKTPWADTTIRL